MRYVKLNPKPLFLVVLVLLTAMILSIPSVVADDSNFKSVQHNPNIDITSDDEVTIHMTVESTDNISSVEYLYCEIDPVGTCTLYMEMTDEGSGTYTAVIPENDGGMTMGYKLKIEYDDGRDEEYYVDKDTYKEYYIEEDPKDDDDSPFVPFPMFVGAILLATLVIRKRT